MLLGVHVVLGLTLVGAAGWASATEIVVGGPVGWGLGVVYNQVNATIGDVLVSSIIQDIPCMLSLVVCPRSSLHHGPIQE